MWTESERGDGGECKHENKKGRGGEERELLEKRMGGNIKDWALKDINTHSVSCLEWSGGFTV